MTSKTAAVLTLGCRLNQADSALLSARLQRMGFQIVPSENSDSSPNLILVNSCAVTAVALKKSLQTMRAVRAENPQSFLVFTGCAAELDREKLEKFPDIDLVIPNSRKGDIERILPRYLACLDQPEKTADAPASPDERVYRENVSTVFPFKTRAILKIQDGCDNACSYCIVPHVRGPERSRDFQETLDDFRRLVEKGFREIVISGVNLCGYHAGNNRLPQLLQAFLEVPGSWRLRIGSLEPGPQVREILDIMADSDGRICPFLHMPLQNGSDAVLKAMNRHCLTGEYADFIRAARKRMPAVHIGTDIIVGFPGETEESFRESMKFLESAAFANIHIFPFSPRPGTPAAAWKPVDRETLEERLGQMRDLKAKLAGKFQASLPGREETVLAEIRKSPSHWEGWSGNYMRTVIASKEDLSGRLVKVRFGEVLPQGGITARLI